MSEYSLACFLVLLVHREVNDKAHFVSVIVDHIHTLCDFCTDLTCKLGSHLLVVGYEVKNIAHFKSASVLKLFSLLVIQELVDRTEILEALIYLDISKTLHADFLSECFHLLKEAF